MSDPNAVRSQGQNKALWAAVSKLVKQGLSKDDAESVMRATVKAVSGQESTRALSSEQAAAVLTRLFGDKKQRPARTRQPQRAAELSPAPAPAELVTPAQQEYLGKLLESLGMDSRAYRGFCQRMLQHPWPQNRLEGGKVTEGLEAMLRRRYTKSVLARYARDIQGVPSISTEDRGFLATILQACGQSKPLSAAQISICLRIGSRYGLAVSSVADSEAGSNPGGGVSVHNSPAHLRG